MSENFSGSLANHEGTFNGEVTTTCGSSELELAGDRQHDAEQRRAIMSKRLMFALAFIIGMGIGLIAKSLASRPTGHYADEPCHCFTLADLVEIELLLPTDATEARIIAREYAAPLIKAIGSGAPPDWVALTSQDCRRLWHSIPVSATAARELFRERFARGGGPAPGRSYRKTDWRTNYEPELKSLPPSLAFLRELPQEQAEYMFIAGTGQDVAFQRALEILKEQRAKSGREPVSRGEQ